ncbi:MAG: hypothetical protein Q7S27_05375 [Nanoarchaeota archaeon]|nr:hypothetical protein [Nanoarchaeota archaeon]
MRRYVFGVIALLLIIVNVSAGELQLVCLNNGETIKFSDCNSAMQDRTCTGGGCQYCATFDSQNGIYCPANINDCNSQAEIECSSLQNDESSNNGSETDQNEGPKNVKADIAYIVKDSSGVDNFLLEYLDSEKYSYEIIYEVNAVNTNFDDYYMILVGNQRLNNPANLPVDKYKSLIINSYNYYKSNSNWQLGWSARISAVSSPGVLHVRDAIHPITKGVPKDFNAYNIHNSGVKTSILKGQKPTGIEIIVYSGSLNSDAVVATVLPGSTYLNGKIAKERALFFGITRAQYWTEDAKKIFSNSLNWVIEGADLDGDGFLSDVDCNDRDPRINPASNDESFNCRNDAPKIDDLRKLTFYSGDLVKIKVDGSDPENDKLIYSIDDSRFIFSETEKEFRWQTKLDDNGEYIFKITVSDGKLSDSENIIIEIKNNPPHFLIIPDISWKEDETKELDLNKYFSDKEGSTLTFSIAETSDNDAISADIVSPGVFKFISEKDWNGEDWVIFRASDGQDRALSNKIKLIVTPINDSPRLIKNISNMEWDEDSKLDNHLDLNDYFEDVDSILQYSASGNKDISIKIENGKASFSTMKDWFGKERVIFTAKDSEFTINSNEIELEINEKGEPPVLGELICERNIIEDQKYNCNLNASDFENNSIIFSTRNKLNLECVVNGNNLEYYSKENYNGIASCDIIASDNDGGDVKKLEVNISGVNDAPIIKSHLPIEGFIKIPEGMNKSFKIEAEDPERDSINIKWLLNNIKEGDGTSYNFKKGKGLYSLRGIVSDSLLDNEIFWSVLVADSSEFMCAEAGFSCSETQFCPSSTFSTIDNLACCSVQCASKPPAFKDFESCETINNSLIVDIESPDIADTLKLGDNIDAEIRIEGENEENLDLDVRVSLYDLTDDKSISEADGNVDLEEGRREVLRFDLEIPNDLDLDNEYVLLAVAEDEVCSQEYIELDIERPKDKVIIDEFTLPEKASCGENINSKIKIKNYGSEEQDVSFTLKNNRLNIDESIATIELEEFDRDDSFSKEFEFIIPENLNSGEFTVTATIRGTLINIVETKSINIECEEEILDELRDLDSLGPIKLDNGNSKGESTQTESNGPNVLLISLMLLATFAGLGFLFFIYNVSKYKQKE